MQEYPKFLTNRELSHLRDDLERRVKGSAPGAPAYDVLLEKLADVLVEVDRREAVHGPGGPAA